MGEFLCMTSCFHIMDQIGQNQRLLVCFNQFTRWRGIGAKSVYSNSILLFGSKLSYNSAENEPISMKSGALWVHCRGLALADFRRDPRRSDSWGTRRNFVFLLSNKNARLRRFPVGQIIRNLNKTRWSVSRWKLSKPNFENFSARGRFSKNTQFFKFSCLATSGRHNSTMITDRRKFTTEVMRYGISSSISTVGINLESFSWNIHSVQETSPSFLRRPTRVDNTSHNADITYSQAASHHRLLSHVTLGLVEHRK